MHSLSIAALAYIFTGFTASFPTSKINTITNLDQSSVLEKASSRISELWAREANQDSDIRALLKHLPELSGNGAHLNGVEKSDRPLSRKMKRQTGSSNDAEADETPTSPSQQEENAALGEAGTSPESLLRLTLELLEDRSRDELLDEI